MKTSPIRYALFAASAILLLAGCVKMPKPGTQNPEEPDNPDSPPPPTEYLYPFGDEPGQITAEIRRCRSGRGPIFRRRASKFLP